MLERREDELYQPVFKNIYTDLSDLSNNFDTYVTRKVLPRDKFFTSWDIDKILSENKCWKMKVSWNHLYLLVNDCKSFDTHTHVGSTAWSQIRILQHNSCIPGGPQDTKRASGFWNLVMWVEIPPFRNFRMQDFINQCNSCRGIDSKCRELLVLAIETRSKFSFSKKLIEDNSSIKSVKFSEKMGQYLESTGGIMEDYLF